MSDGPTDPELSDVADVLVRELPLGMRRRIAFEVVLRHRPRLLVLTSRLRAWIR